MARSLPIAVLALSLSLITAVAGVAAQSARHGAALFLFGAALALAALVPLLLLVPAMTRTLRQRRMATELSRLESYPEHSWAPAPPRVAAATTATAAATVAAAPAVPGPETVGLDPALLRVWGMPRPHAQPGLRVVDPQEELPIDAEPAEDVEPPSQAVRIA